MGAPARTGGHDADAVRLLDVALRYAAHGWPVVPLHTPHAGGCSCRHDGCASAGKHPRTARGLHEASVDPARIAGWWSRWPDANLGVVTGAASRLVVLDVDLPHGPASLARLEAAHGPLRATCEQRTGSGGRQVLFAHPGQPVSNRTRVEPGLDVRGDGGYIVVPPSIHACGERYRWTGRLPPAAMPGWLLELLDRTRTPDLPTLHAPAAPLPAGGLEDRYAVAALQQELARVASAVEGSRNDTLNRAAFNLGQLAAAGLLDLDRVAGALERAAVGNGLGPVETRRTIASGLAAGQRHPRTPPASQLPDRRPVSPSPPVRRIAPRSR